MAITVKSLFQLLNTTLVFIGILGTSLIAEDQIKSKITGKIQSGKILKVEGGSIYFQSSIGTIPFELANTEVIEMTPPDEFQQAQTASPAATIELLEPLVQKFQGLPVDWIVTAMGQLADAYTAQNNNAKANSLYDQINQLYPNSIYHYLADAGKAKSKLAEGKANEALALLQPALDEANKKLTPDPKQAGIYAKIFITEGQILEAKKQFPEALEAYLTVKTLFYQNSSLKTEAETLAQKLRDAHPDLAVN